MSPSFPRILLCCFVAIGSEALAQQQNNAGHGGVYRHIELNALTGNNAHLGVCDIGGNLYVSARDPLLQGNHLIYKITPANVVTSFAQPVVQGQSVWGMRDLCTDGTNIAGGSEVGISIVDTTGAMATTWAGQPVTQPIGGAVLAAIGTIRGLAWDPAANSGNGLFYAVDYDSAIIAFDRAGVVLGTHPNPKAWYGYGLAIDALTGNLWINAAPQRGDIAEIDKTTFQPTGRTIPSAVPCTRAGGLSEASIVAGHHAPWATLSNLVQLRQGDPDVLEVNRVHLLPGKRGWDEMRLQTTANSTGWNTGRAFYGPGDTLGLRVFDPLGTHNGLPCWIIFNLLPEAGLDGITDLTPYIPSIGILAEHRSRNSANQLNPTQDFAILPWSVGPAHSIPLPIGPVVPQDVIRIQALLLDLSQPTGFISSNEAWWQGGVNQAGVLVEAVGADSFDSSTGSGFWRVRHLGGTRPAIRSVTLDWSACAVPGQESMVFDVAQNRMGDRHDGGNEGIGGCRGTYRNGSDATAGLDYGNAGNYQAPCAAGSKNSGFTSTAITAGCARDLTYRFLGTMFGSGVTFEWDCDTDGGLGVSGKSMAGLVVRVTLVDSTVLTGTLAADPLHPHRAFVLLP